MRFIDSAAVPGARQHRVTNQTIAMAVVTASTGLGSVHRIACAAFGRRDATCCCVSCWRPGCLVAALYLTSCKQQCCWGWRQCQQANPTCAWRRRVPAHQGPKVSTAHQERNGSQQPQAAALKSPEDASATAAAARQGPGPAAGGQASRCRTRLLSSCAGARQLSTLPVTAAATCAAATLEYRRCTADLWLQQRLWLRLRAPVHWCWVGILIWHFFCMTPLAGHVSAWLAYCASS